MKKTINTFKSLAMLALITMAVIACDKDYANIDSDIQGVRNFNASSKKFSVLSYTKHITPFNTASPNMDMVGIETSNIIGSLFGVYKDPNTEFGIIEASTTLQVTPTTFNHNFGEDLDEVSIDSVYLRIPYFTTNTSTDSEGVGTYKFDSIFGNPEATYKLSIYRNNYFLADLDPTAEFNNDQKYYSNQGSLFDNQLGELLYEIDEFKPSIEEIPVYAFNEGTMENEIVERFTPSLYIKLFDSADSADTFWFDTFITNQQDSQFSNANNFRDFFRGITFKVESITGDGSIMFIDFLSNQAGITINYTNGEEVISPEVDVRNQTVYNLSFSGRKVNTLVTSGATNLDGNVVDGDDNLYLKSGDGTMAVINLFGNEDLNVNGISDEEEEFRNKKDKWLINEANLIFKVNKNMLQGDGEDERDEPERLILFDLKNNVPIIDYFLDATNNQSPSDSKPSHAVRLERDSNGDGMRYKFRITEHMNNILIRDSTNVKLGLFVTSNINFFGSSTIQGQERDDDDSTIDVAPVSSVLSVEGTIVHGSKLNIPEEDRIEFEIFYTEPEN